MLNQPPATGTCLASATAPVPAKPGAVIATIGAGLHVSGVSAGFTRLLGHAPIQARGRRLDELLRGPDTDEPSLQALCAAIASGQEWQTVLLIRTAHGTARWMAVSASALRGDGGAAPHSVVVLDEVTHVGDHAALQHLVLDAMAQGAPLHDAARLLCREMEQAVPGCTAVLLARDAQGRLRIVAAPSLPPALESLVDGHAGGARCGCCTAATTGQAVRAADIASDPRWDAVGGAFVAHGLQACHAYPVASREGAVLGVFALYCPETLGTDGWHEQLANAGLHLCTLLLEREHERARIHQLAYYDGLTGLANRSMLNAQAARMLHEAQRSGAALALVFIDLDHFKQINDTHGHLAGDALLRAVAARLQDSARASDLAARLGGDEFVLLLTRCDARQAALAAERLLNAFSRPVSLPQATLQPRASMGIALFPDDGADADTLLHCADLAMYQAKTAGGQCWRFHNAAMNDQARRLSLLEADLRQALATGGLALHYQPQMQGGGLHGVEALLRWQHPTLGAIAPERLTRTADECGLRAELTRWVVGEACRQMADWRARGVAVPRVSVNLRGADLHEPELMQWLTQPLGAHGLQTADLAVEIAEDALCSPDSAALARAHALRRHGITLALDNFGTGYCKLDNLHLLPIDELKLDRGFVRDIETSATARALIRAMLHIARGLGLSIVAEGVETPAQQQFLHAHGCVLMQGHLLSPPLAAPALERLLREAGTAASQVSVPKPT